MPHNAHSFTRRVRIHSRPHGRAPGPGGFAGSIVEALAAAVPDPRLVQSPRGTHTYAVDSKGRLVCSKELKPVLGDPFILTRAPGGCLLAFNARVWKDLARRHRAEGVFGVYFRSAAVQVETDRVTSSTPAGRFQLPIELRRHAALHPGTQVALVDLGTAVLLCPKDRWDAHVAEVERRLVAALVSPPAQLLGGTA